MSDLNKKINEDPDFINSKRHKFSLLRFMEKNPTGTTENVICHLLSLTSEEFTEIYQNIVNKARIFLKIQ